ncbi:hypothetical protein UFOVP181_440 [uncultured Caudovirales phage]|uniref:Uncharacterized protein n=1 Tax=uncultured Caudovirales phage TaxID=2100421 RepID=A0A6J5KT86_9CAUD|nr:hypothetical protein UFOVP57_201 [uncultured Caudovirales phage]CAB5209343.1 hypothetical protein UFOVP181_440 [uncultured Caudovirales phage]
MKEFNFDVLTEDQICSKGLTRALIAEDQNFFTTAFEAAEFIEINDGDYEVAVTAAEAVLESVNKALKEHGLEIKRVDLIENMAWILVPKTVKAQKVWAKALG